ncbi:uncharacterized protein BO80DRAFT_465532 [Aspergillus ibericus CBS 121593]|uniref:Uncharacterized protein n=1 Tax=Aspergillus ibericus CBS 121593 TaxID=1448316 RepID=A0A395GX28_9EURO|nr:hypothetical protein BO80DRAFT_465532 [Aspergillus ibericus CBS 121593]RAL00086.1 hypothetical protein BO80DRAFT_465532 [Aspergillus ibericus CBS 121593]
MLPINTCRILWSLAQAQSAFVCINTLAFTVMVVHPSDFRHLYNAAHPLFLVFGHSPVLSLLNLLLMRAFVIPSTMSCAIGSFTATVQRIVFAVFCPLLTSAMDVKTELSILRDAAVTLRLVAFIEQLDLLLSRVAACRRLVAPGALQTSPFDIDSEG